MRALEFDMSVGADFCAIKGHSAYHFGSDHESVVLHRIDTPIRRFLFV